jgi:hypothetical protein
VRAVAITVLALCGCGGDTASPAVSVLLSGDGSHACAGAVSMTVTLSEVNGDATTESTVATAVAPEQLDCDFDVGVAEGAYALAVGEMATGRPHTVTVELFDSTGFTVAAGGSEPFEARARKSNDAINVELTRVAPVGTVLVDLLAEADTAVAGDLDIVLLAGNDPIGSRNLEWSGDNSLKRPLRISGLLGVGLRIMLTLEDAGIEVFSYLSEPFALGSADADAFATPVLDPM